MRVIVVGGGLAGMVAAREVAGRGHSVVVLERSGRLGGKAGSDQHEGRRIEHGYHVFPKWYPNVRRILGEIGTTLIDFDRYHYIVEGRFPAVVTVRGPADIPSVLYNLTHGLLPWYQTLLFFGFTLDMISRPLSDKRLLDRVSQIGLMRQAWYVTEQVAELNQENLLKASAIPAYDMSAMTAKRIAGYWIREAAPFLSVLPGDLQTTFIDPFAEKLRASGVEVRLDTEVSGLEVSNGRVSGVRLSTGTILDADAFVLATPFEVSRRFIDEPVFLLDPSLGNMHHLEAQPMAALHVRLRRRIQGIPREHVFFHGGSYGLSLIDVGALWKREDAPASELSFISSNFAPLVSLSEQDATEALLAEIRRYIPLQPADVIDTVLNTNISTPLFINTIGAWPNRPAPKTAAPNLYIAGDYVRNAIDLACMEGAVSSGLAAARALLQEAGSSELPEILVPKTWPRPLLVAARWAMLPPIAIASTIARIKEAISPSKPSTRSHPNAPMNGAR